MKLSKLHLSGFGKFESYDMELGSGLNIVYGDNESGKSTLVGFIKSIFFGFKKDNTRNRSFQPEYEQFYPWLARVYGGAVEYELKGSHYRVERIFDRKKEEIKVYRLESGQEITRSFPYDRNKREYIFAGDHLGMQEKVFSSSIMLEQGAFAIDSQEAAPLVREKLINLLMTGDEEVSLKRALQVIERARDEIGTARSQKKPLGEAVAKLEGLGKELSDLENQLKNLNSKEKLLGQKRHELTAIRDEVELLQKANLYLEAADHFQGYVQTQEKLIALQPEEVASQLRAQREAFEQWRTKTEQQRQDLEGIDREIKVDNPEFWIQRIDNLNETILNINRESSNLETRVGDNTQKAWGKRKLSAVFTTTSLLMIIGFLVCLYLHLPIPFTGSSLLLAVLLAIMAFKSNHQYQEISRAGHEVDVRKNMNNLLIMENQNLLNDILAQLGAKDTDQAKKYLQDSVRLRNRKKEIQKNIESSQREVLLLESKIQLLEERMVEIQNLTTEIDKERAILQSLGFKDVDKSTRDFFDISTKFHDKFAEDSRKIELEIQELSQRYEGVLLEIGKLEQQLDERFSVLNRYNDVQGNILSWRQKLEELNQNLEILALAQKGIEEAVSGYQQDYLKKLNQRSSQIVEELFQGRYQTVNLTENLEILTVAPETMKMITAEQTSRGTAELLYLALRLALADILSSSGDGLFIVWDEPFANLDTPRLEQLIAFLSSLAQGKQVIIFTCREEVLRHLPPTANIINLEQTA